jgi:tRNA dimethylallyltransferase
VTGKFLIAIAGPTAIGKTALAIKLAQRYHCDIVSCDSRQFFGEMRIGTAVPTDADLNAARHHFIGHKSIFESYSVGDFEKDATAFLDDWFRNRDIAIMVGGSGLYFDAVLKGIDAFPAIDLEVRAGLRSLYAASGIGPLQQKLIALDPDYYAQVDKQNPQRLMRALEVCMGSGRPYSSYLKKNERPRNFTPILIGLETDREALYDRINRRVDEMMREGLAEEARSLYPHRGLNALQTVGYRELFEHFDGRTTLDAAVSEIKKNTRRFAKRQLTWFRRNEEMKWFDPLCPTDEFRAYIDSFIGGKKKPG